MPTETEPIPNTVVGDSERDAVESKKREGFRKPKSERPPNRISETAVGGASIPGMSRVADPAANTSGTVVDLCWSANFGHFVSWDAKLKKSKKIIYSPSRLTDKN